MDNSLERRIQKLEDENEIRKLMAKYVYYGYGRVWERVPEMFANRDDVWIDCETLGTFDGKKGLESFFVEWHHALECDGLGTVALHLLTTDVVEVAGDGKTARGIWFSPGMETRHLNDTSKATHGAYWIWGMYAIDFIKEDGVWKFWHFRIPHLFMCDYYNSWVDFKYQDSENAIRRSGPKPEPDRPSSINPTYYKTDQGTSMFYEPPKPYKTENDLAGFWEIKKH